MLLIQLLSTLVGVSAVDVPGPYGPFGVALSSHVLKDPNRQDPYSPDTTQRMIVVSVFLPVDKVKTGCEVHRAPYMPPITASLYDSQAVALGLPDGLFEAFEFALCTIEDKPHFESSGIPSYPVALFSPGQGNSRHMYGALARSIASQGYVVVTIDHPYDAAIVEFPDGSVITAANISTAEELETAVIIRSQDMAFVADRLRDPSTARDLIGCLHAKIRADQMIVLGHSLGGATAFRTMLHDPRLRGGVDLDGSLIVPGNIMSGLNNPFLLFGRADKNLSSDITWADFWPHLHGPRVALSLMGAKHGTFTDFPLLLDAVDIMASPGNGLEELYGQIDGARVFQILTHHLLSFFNFVTGHDRGAALSLCESIGYPEVEVLACEVQSKLTELP